MKPPNLIRPVHPALLLCALTILLPLGCKKEATAPAPEVYVQAVHPSPGSLSEQITADATLAPLAQAAISPKITAPVKKFYVQRGSHVKAGELLVTLENSDLQAAALDNKGVYTAAQGAIPGRDLDTAKAALVQAQAAYDIAKQNLDAIEKVGGTAALQSAQGQLTSAKGKYL
ncbi:MAG: biotin/lipoyl-binding protein, partial [Edaphobacter sp.]